MGIMMKLSSILLTVCLVLANGCSVNGRTISSEEDIELEKELSALLKPSVKTIKTEYGDLYDCVDINKQPALDHPLLKNHKIKMVPSFDLEKNSTASKWNTPETNGTKLGLSEGCPEGFVPIRRTTKEDLRRAKSLFAEEHQFMSTTTGQSNPSQHGYIFAGIVSQPPQGESFKGIAARINVYNLEVDDEQSSAAIIMLQKEIKSLSMAAIQVGWRIDHKLYGDTQTRFFTEWSVTRKGKVSGCYNLLCPGFVVVNKKIPIDAPFVKTSISGVIQVFEWMKVNVDPLSGDWWLSIHDEEVRIGYWPKELFAGSGLDNEADTALWGGLVHSNTAHQPPMGSGNFEEADADKTCNMDNVQVSVGYNFVTPDDLSVQVVESKCYQSQKVRLRPNHYRFLFGGAGGTGC